jgi:hypothetical protein
MDPDLQRRIIQVVAISGAIVVLSAYNCVLLYASQFDDVSQMDSESDDSDDSDSQPEVRYFSHVYLHH